MAAWGRFDDGLKLGMHRDGEHSAGLLLLDVNRTIADVLGAHSTYVATPLAGIEQQRERQPGAGTDAMIPLELRDLTVCPTVMPFTSGTDRLHIAAFLQQFARHIQRQIGGIDYALHEPQIRWQQLLGVVHDEHALHVQLQPAAMLAVPQVERRMLRHVQQLRVLAAALDAVVRPRERVVVVVRDVLIELLVLLVADIALRACPQRARLVDGLVLVLHDHLALLGVPLFLLHENG